MRRTNTRSKAGDDRIVREPADDIRQTTWNRAPGKGSRRFEGLTKGQTITPERMSLDALL